MCPCSLAVDIGGTFTDVVLHASEGGIWVDKTLTTPDDLLDGFFRGVALVLGRSGKTPADIDGLIVHATTTVTNALIERRGPKTALLVTAGFEDVLAIRSEHRYDIYDLQIEYADPLVPAELTFGVRERVLAEGSIRQEVDPAEVEAIADRLRALDVASVAVCFLNGYRNPDNERRVADGLRRALPGLFLSLSSDVAPQIREYPRASTTAINAYTQPIAQPYLHDLAGRLHREGFRSAPSIMLSSGGVIGTDVAGRHPVRMIESGPAAGALAAAHFARRFGIDRLMSFDMGGTTAKACLIEGGLPLLSGSQEVDRRYRFKEGSGMPVLVPAIDLIEIGAGGGSIATVDSLGLLKVGPRSAGSTPGPACYGRGGTLPTVTDANLLLGLIDPDNFLGGDMKLDRAAAARAYERLGAALGLGAVAAAAGVYRIVAEAMASAARTHATDRGVDYRGIPLLAFGGAGPLHAWLVGELLESASIIFPPHASVLSAYGTLVSSPRIDLVRSAVAPLLQLDWEMVDRLFADMRSDAETALVRMNIPPSDIAHQYGADLRFAGQQTEIFVRLPAEAVRLRDGDAIVATFLAAYTTYYGIAPTHVPLELVSWRLVATGPEPRLVPLSVATGTPSRPKVHRATGLWGTASVPVHDRAGLVRDQTVRGPALIEERETTIAIGPGWSAVVDASGCITATRS